MLETAMWMAFVLFVFFGSGILALVSLRGRQPSGKQLRKELQAANERCAAVELQNQELLRRVGVLEGIVTDSDFDLAGKFNRLVEEAKEPLALSEVSSPSTLHSALVKQPRRRPVK